MNRSPSGAAAMNARVQTGRLGCFAGEHAFLSNFYPSPIIYEGVPYPTVEHAFQAAKTLDRQKRDAIAHEPTPGRAKRAGHPVELRADWEEIKNSAMGALLRQKFVTHASLAIKLIATSAAHLEEGNWHGDRCWGTVDGVGENRLGRILMGVRDELVQIGLAFREHTSSGEAP